MHTILQVGRMILCLRLPFESKLCLVLLRNMWHLAGVCEELTGFFAILRLSFRQILIGLWGKQATGIRNADPKRESFSLRSPHDNHSRSVIQWIYRGIKNRCLYEETVLFAHILCSRERVQSEHTVNTGLTTNRTRITHAVFLFASHWTEQWRCRLR